MRFCALIRVRVLCVRRWRYVILLSCQYCRTPRNMKFILCQMLELARLDIVHFFLCRSFKSN